MYVGISGNTSATHWAAIAHSLPNVSPHTSAPVELYWIRYETLHPVVVLADGPDILNTDGYSAAIISMMIVEGTSLWNGSQG